MPKSETGLAPLKPSWTMTSPAVNPPGFASTVMVCVGLMGSAATTLAVPRLVVSVES
jgi:hypothetical protein